MGPSIQNLSEPRLSLRIAHTSTGRDETVQPCQVPDSMAWIIAHGTWCPRLIRWHPTIWDMHLRMYCRIPQLLIDLTEWLYRQHTHLPIPQNTPTPGATQ
jgi:hypothetical protein